MEELYIDVATQSAPTADLRNLLDRMETEANIWIRQLPSYQPPVLAPSAAVAKFDAALANIASMVTKAASIVSQENYGGDRYLAYLFIGVAADDHVKLRAQYDPYYHFLQAVKLCPDLAASCTDEHDYDPLVHLAIHLNKNGKHFLAGVVVGMELTVNLDNRLAGFHQELDEAGVLSDLMLIRDRLKRA